MGLLNGREFKTIKMKNLHNCNGFDGGFTVLMSVYHKEDPIRFQKALSSIYSNTLLPDAMILVVDGSVPESLECIIIEAQKRYRNFKVHRMPQNRGLATALNEGLSQVRTKWIVRADSDDFNRVDRFEKQAIAIAKMNPPIDVLGGAIQEIDYDGSPLAVRRTVESYSSICNFVRHRNPFNHMTVAYRTELVRKVGGYPNIFLKEDYALWALLIKSGANCANLPDILVDATTGKEMYRRRGGLKYALTEISLQKHLLDTKVKSLFEALYDGVVRGSVFLMPSAIRAVLYTMLLRK